ncbi:hypothetical protein TOPH_02380 [Tolypocladium ophioglossoides CBS 100239]|uniref:Phosphoglycerate mutase n=1 Tax=Tolypocladium ophioglossoides (strain CBS 100239) TaxID=1163406 RepID=A0A0L0NG33_TOLOC|nr:hypothetical protein TOPH_02380 [Tolypocladium ophioglossoides CBS 100239]
MLNPSARCLCPPLELRTWHNGDAHAQTSQSHVADFSLEADEEGVSIIFADAIEIRKCLRCRLALSAAFGIPELWWDKVYRRANGYFGYEEVPDPRGQQDGAISWCRFKVKHTKKPEVEELRDMKKAYYWPKLNVFSRWYKTRRHTAVIVFDPDKLRDDVEADTLRDNFTRCLENSMDPKELEDPFWIYPRLVEEVVKLQDEAVWSIRDRVRETEQKRHTWEESGPDYPMLHEIQRHAIHVSETLEVASTTMEWMQKHHEQFLRGPEAPSVASGNIASRLSFHRHMFISLLKRSNSNKERLQSEIGLAFNTVAQQNSRTSVQIANATRSDSATMRIIAFVSLLFLPSTYISAIFSTSFFKFDDNSVWRVSDKFWVYWAVAVPLTLILAADQPLLPSVDSDQQKGFSSSTSPAPRHPLIMSKSPPAYLFVVRHGNRLDAADKKWHLTSPTPYDPPLTYGGLLQGRQVGNQIGSFLEQAKLDDEVSQNGASLAAKRKRFKIVIHSSPFLRCVQTSIGIASGLAQTSPDSIYNPADIIVPKAAPTTQPLHFKSALLRLDSFLGEWLSPEYFEMITPPPGPALMLGGAKADLLRREDYSAYAGAIPPEKPASSGSLWQASPTLGPTNRTPWPASEKDGTLNMFALTSGFPDEAKGYVAPRPMYAVSSNGKIPEGFVAHARDACATVDYQWDSMREPLNFGDGGKFGEEWTAMHTRFRGGLRKLINWYATTDAPADLVAKPAKAETGGDGPEVEREDEEIETVVIIVSHGAGCNALIGAITHQPVLLDVGIASITMATRKPGLDYQQMLSAAQAFQDSSAQPLVQVDKMYDMRLSASTEHLQSNGSTPVSSGSQSSTNIWNAPKTGTRGRTSTLGSNSGGPVMSPFTYSDPLSSPGSRSTSAGAAVGNSFRRDSGSYRPVPRGPAIATASLAGVTGGPSAGNRSPGGPSFGLWSPVPSSLRLMDDGSDDSDDFGSMLPDFDQSRFKTAATDSEVTEAEAAPTSGVGGARSVPETDRFAPEHSPQGQGPMFAGPIRLHTSLGPDKPIEEMKMAQLGGGLGGLWGIPPPPDEAERFRDLSHTKRRWTVNERA